MKKNGLPKNGRPKKLSSLPLLSLPIFVTAMQPINFEFGVLLM
jgi:hypothetical protein